MPSLAKPSKTYWTLQILGWLSYATIGYATNIRFNSDVSATKVATIAIFGSGLLFLSTHFLRNYARGKHWHQLSFGRLILRLLGATLLISTCSQLLVSLLMYWPLDLFTPEKPYSITFLVIYIFQTQIILMLWSLAYFSYQAIRNYKSEEIEKWRLQAAVKDAELIALKAQINPHFIFNCLNNIRALVLEDSEKARDAITKLSDLLRSSIQSNKAERIQLAEELTVVKDYLDLEKIHMEERLSYNIDCPTECENAEIPPMAIQILVENAIKHGLARRPKGGEISISIQNLNTELTIEVSNTGSLSAPNPQSTGVGLQNVRNRLHLLHGKSASLSLREQNVRVFATIRIPTSPVQIP
ncbi:sensor histidine kinase [Pelagicoccus mobilis]|uniref:Histidine kinase n=1 Tax=Pelagicoccus mobilis TaxID=415221 RepID=A0A934RX99_9BACT|nr:histidine kinase [Pelagicoccus mobilis]MBK1876914.1 histidine kinase [Pelagicoccus mobilis]